MSNEGWICPVCKRGKAPHIETCDCARNSQRRKFALRLVNTIAPKPHDGWVLPYAPFPPPIFPTPPYRVTWHGLPEVLCGDYITTCNSQITGAN